jgi:hypothetical protein
MLECYNCKYAKEIKLVTKYNDQDIGCRSFYWILCTKSGVAETAELLQKKPLSCEVAEEDFNNIKDGAI